jgi:uncharacterized protein YeaO (DUF488 family)
MEPPRRNRTGDPILTIDAPGVHDPERFEEFSRRYREELKDAERAQALEQLRELANSGTLTLLTATKHAEISEAAVLAALIRG